MRNIIIATILAFSFAPASGQLFQFKKPALSGAYAQWGYNRDRFSRSDLHFEDGDNYNFTVHNAYGKDQPDFSGFRDAPIDITIPQNSVRFGVYLNPQHTWAIEVNYDHAKYVVEDYQTLRISGHIHGRQIDKDTFITKSFLHLEHTNGANFWQLNYVWQHPILKSKKRVLATFMGRVGAGVVIPHSDVTLMGNKLDNKYHVAGYVTNMELGSRFFITKNIFLEANIKGGFANYLNVLTLEGGRANHHFWYGEVIGLVGYDISFWKGKGWHKVK